MNSSDPRDFIEIWRMAQDADGRTNRPLVEAAEQWAAATARLDDHYAGGCPGPGAFCATYDQLWVERVHAEDELLRVLGLSVQSAVQSEDPKQ